MDRVVEDDVVDLVPGDQLVVDGEVLVSNGMEIDESLLTGESATNSDGEADCFRLSDGM